MKKSVFLLFLFLAIAICGFTKSIIVQNAAELKAADANALPGDIIILKNGNWKDVKMVLTAKGKENQPVIYRAETMGQVKITGKSSLRINGSYIIVDGLHFVNGMAPEGNVWEFRHKKEVASHSRITNSIIESFNNDKRLDDNNWVALYGKNNRIDHCSFINKTNLGVLMAVVLDDDRSRLNDHSIDSNYFGFRTPLGSNGGEIIRVGVSQHCTFYSNTSIRNNFFEYCDGETEIVSIKSCGNKVTGNVFKECQGAVVLRHGDNNTVEGNLFYGNNKKGTGGVRVINEGNWVVNNFFSGLRGEAFRSPLAIMNGIFNSPPHRYMPVKDAVIAYNSFVNCAPISFGEGADEERTIAPSNVYFFNNLFYMNQQDTMLAYVFSGTGDYSFSNNVINREIKNTPAGFSVQQLQSQKFDNISFPVFTGTSTKMIVPDSIMAQASKRLERNYGSNYGASDLNYFKTLLSNKNTLGAKWKPEPKLKALKPTTVRCRNGDELNMELEKQIGNTVTIELTGTHYEFKKPLRIYSHVTITGNKNEISFSSKTTLPNLFQIKGSNQLNFKNIRINAKGLKTHHFIVADSSDQATHYSLNIHQSVFKNLSAASFFKAGKTSYADSIVVTSSSFISNKTNLFDLTEEKDNKGFYNVENIKMTGNKIENHSGSIIDIYRGGNDESTMGPMIIFSRNHISNSLNNQALIHFYGVQESEISNNKFSKANPGKILVKYVDIVKAKHFQCQNDFLNSGTISENKFVINL